MDATIPYQSPEKELNKAQSRHSGMQGTCQTDALTSVLIFLAGVFFVNSTQKPYTR